MTAAPLTQRTRLCWLGAWLLLWAVHVALLFSFVAPSTFFSTRPISGIDYSLHYYQVDRAARSLRSTGHLWAWDPGQLAGQPSGTVEDMSSKTLELFVIALTSVGIGQGLAFNLYILCMHLLVPLLALASGRAYRLGRGTTYVLALLWVLLWHFDSYLHWCWYCGMISWTFVSALSVLTVGLVWRAFASVEEGQGGWGWLIAAVLACGLVALSHPLATAFVALPCALLYFRGWRKAAWRRHVLVAGCIGSATAAALVWLLPAIPIYPWVEKSEFFLRPSPAFLLYDYFDLQMSASATGPPVQTMLRYFCLAAAALMLWKWRGERDSRLLPVLTMLASGLLIAYGGRYVFVTSTAQPYRVMAPLTLAAAVPTAMLLGQVLTWRSLRALSPLARATLIILALLAVPRAVRVATAYYPSLAPSMFFERRLPAPQHPINTVLGAWSMKMENLGPSRVFRDVRGWLLANHKGRGRVLVADYDLGEYLAATTDLPIIGGFAYRPLHHADANLFQYERPVTKTTPELRAYLERYAIGFVVMRSVHWRLENNRELFDFQRSFGLLEVRVFETKIEPSYVLRGGGRLVAQELNRIVVDDATGPEVDLRFHWFPSLRCRPDCTVERLPVEGDRVGFLRVKTRGGRFEVYNSYRFR
jgi:hypothetical protein